MDFFIDKFQVAKYKFPNSNAVPDLLSAFLYLSYSDFSNSVALWFVDKIGFQVMGVRVPAMARRFI